MTQNPTATMVMSQRPSGDILITLISVARLRREGDSDDTIRSLGDSSHLSVVLLLVYVTVSNVRRTTRIVVST